MKCFKYEQRILDVKKSNFVPLVFSCNGGAGPSATRIIKQLAIKNSEKKDIARGAGGANNMRPLSWGEQKEKTPKIVIYNYYIGISTDLLIFKKYKTKI